MADGTNLIELTIEVVASYVAKNHLRAEDVPDLIGNIHSAIAALDVPAEQPAPEPTAAPEHQPATTVRKSLASDDHIVSMIDGKPYRTLTRHLGRHGLTPDEYRQRYRLKADYPMVARSYSAARSAAAKARGFGRKVVDKVEELVGIEPGAASQTTPKRRGRKPKEAPAS